MGEKQAVSSPPSSSTADAASIAQAAAIASVATKASLHPIDTLKCRVQAGDHPPGVKGFLAHWRGRWSLKDLYRGLPAKAALYGPYQSIYMTSYQTTKSSLKEWYPQNPTWLTVAVSSVIAELVSAVVRVPMECLKMRLQASVYTNTLTAMREIQAAGLRPMLRLATPQIFVHDIPYSLSQWLCYEHLTPVLRPYVDATLAGLGATAFTSVFAGAISGCVAGCITTPLDVVKTRVVVGSRENVDLRTIDVVRQLYADRGWRGFTRGVFVRMGWISANTALYFGLFETLRAHLRQRSLRAASPLPESS